MIRTQPPLNGRQASDLHGDLRAVRAHPHPDLHMGCLMAGFWLFVIAFTLYCLGWILLGLWGDDK